MSANQTDFEALLGGFSINGCIKRNYGGTSNKANRKPPLCLARSLWFHKDGMGVQSANPPPKTNNTPPAVGKFVNFMPRPFAQFVTDTPSSLSTTR